MNSITYSNIAARIWFHTFLILSFGASILFLLEDQSFASVSFIFLFMIISAIGSLPALLILLFALIKLDLFEFTAKEKILLLIIINLFITLLYGLCSAYLLNDSFYEASWLSFFKITSVVTAILFICSCMAVAINSSIIKKYFSLQENDSNNYLLNQTYTCMENSEQTISASPLSTGSSHSNKILYKGIITAVLILLMLIPMMFIQDLVKEREQRQNEVVNEVSSKWATAQTITTPYLAVPYKDTISKKTKHLIILSENLDVTGNVIPEERTRSIYKVLLYRSALNLKANFHFKLPADIDAKDIYFSDAKLCLGLSDFKGIEEKIKLSYNTVPVAMTPGLPVSNIDSIGLSAPVQINASDNISFDVSLKLKGSERLNFMPLSANSNFQLSSSWQNPSFDGNILPSQRIIDNNGFKATWSFNEANLPFATILKDEKIDKESFAFGVNMVQPADQYAKTMRSVKYAILFIGLTFALFFIIELMQQKPVHPVQYVLVGLALVIFYSLLLSISEFLLFNQAYLIAASAIVILITLYAKGHFRSWKIAGIFGTLLTALYGFIYILISLEDTALLVGSIGLFAVLSLIMYASRKINWYNPMLNHPATALEK